MNTKSQNIPGQQYQYNFLVYLYEFILFHPGQRQNGRPVQDLFSFVQIVQLLRQVFVVKRVHCQVLTSVLQHPFNTNVVIVGKQKQNPKITRGLQFKRRIPLFITSYSETTRVCVILLLFCVIFPTHNSTYTLNRLIKPKCA